MSWTTATSELRNLLADGPTDKYRYRKRVFGIQDGTNKNFKTFEYRRVTDFVAPTGFLGVYVNNTLATVSVDELTTGEFQLATAPANTAEVVASYYLQWFTDAELDSFMVDAANWLGLAGTVTGVPQGLRPAALKWGAADAYQKLALRYAIHVAENFRLEDAPDPATRTPVDMYTKMADQWRKDATASRDEYYTRQGQALQPLFISLTGAVPDPTPRR